MITIENIIEWSKSHPIGGKTTRIKCGDIEFSIVGGRSGLYGDFVNDFELAIFDGNGAFITRNYFPNINDDVVGYLSGEDLVDKINSIIIDDNFQVL